MQSKKALSLASLVAAVPAGILTYYMVMVFINYADKMSTILLVSAGTTLLCCGIILFVPIAALVFGGRRAARKTAEAESGDAEETEALTAKSKGGKSKGDAEEADLIDDAEVEAGDGMDETMEFDDDLTAESEDLDNFETFDDLDDLDDDKK